MGNISSEVKDLLIKYHGDTKLAMKEEPELKYFLALSVTRENVLEWGLSFGGRLRLWRADWPLQQAGEGSDRSGRRFRGPGGKPPAP